MSGNQGETKSGLAAPAVVIPQLNQAQSEALARGRTIGHYGHGVQASPFTLRQRAVYEDEGPRWDDGGGALFTARTKGVLRGIHEVGQHRVAAAPVIRAIGRRNLEGRFAGMGRMSAVTQNPQNVQQGLPTFITRHVTGLAGEKTPISDLTKTSLGAPSKREKRRGKKMREIRRKDARARGGRRRKRRKTKRKRKRKRTKKFRKGSRSKTHRGKDFETRKTSKNYNSKRWKRMTGRRTRRAPLFPFV